MGGPQIVRACQKLIKVRHPSLVFLMESKLKAIEAEKLNHKLGFKNAVWLNCSGEGRKRARRLGLLWDEEVELSLMYFLQNHIDAKVKDVVDNKEWRFTGFYGHLEENRKHLS